MSIAPTKSKGRCHQARTGQFFTKSGGPLDIKIAATLHSAGPNNDFVATFANTDTEQSTIAIHKKCLIITLLSFAIWKSAVQIQHTTSLYTYWVHNQIEISKIRQRQNIYHHQFLKEEEDPMKTKRLSFFFIFLFIWILHFHVFY